MKTRNLKAYLVLFLVAMMPALAISQGLTQRQYTKEHPLVYEDAWDLWPYVFLNERGEPQGYNVDMLKLVLGELHIPYVIKLKPTIEALEDLRAGKSDLMLRLAETFHDDYSHYGEEVVQMFTHSIVSPKDKVPVKVQVMDDLGHNKVIVHAGSLSHRMMKDKGWESNCIPIDDMKEAIQRVSTANDGMILWNTLSLKWLMNKYHTANLQITPIDIPHGEYKFMSNDTLLLHRLDSVYARLCATDRMQPILNKWFYPERVESGIPGWVTYATAFVGLLAFLLFYYITNLRVRERSMTQLIAKHNRRLALILHTTKVWVWLYDIQHRQFVWMNEDGEMDDREYTVEEFAADYDADSFEQLTDALAKIAVEEKTGMVVELTSSGDGNDVRKYVCTLSVFRSTNKGYPAVIVGMMDDQTERLTEQNKAKDSMLRYQTIFSSSMVDMTYYNTEGILTEINQKACMTFNCDRDQLLAEKVPFTSALEDDSLTIDNFEGTYTTHIIKDSSKTGMAKSITFAKDFYYEQLLTPVYDSGKHFLGIFGSGRDVSEFVNSYHRLKQSISQLMAAAHDVTEYINNINYALHVGGVRLASYSPDEHTLTIFKEMNIVQLKLTQSRCLALVDDSSKRSAMRLLNSMDMLNDDLVNVTIKTTIRTKDGKCLALQFHFVPVYDAAGTIDSYFGLCRDVTQEQATEEELVHEKAKAQEVEYVKNVFLRNMSHEIRTPISTVVGFAELFSVEHDQEDEEGFIREIKSNANYLLKLVNDILFLSRLDAHMIEFNRTPIDFAYTFEGHCQMGWAKQMKEGVNYVVENPYEHLVVDIDDANVGHIIEQVAENAAHYTVSGHIRTRYDYIGDRLLITIEDTGCGIAPENQLRLFERFYISEDSTGTGLGLPICKELAQQMGGSIYINSGSGRGTTVWILIPCKATMVEKKLCIN